MSAPLHATLVARFKPGGWRGVLLQGPSGAGKSALALALMQKGWALVADDRVIAWLSGGCVWGRAPGTLHGLLEVRGAGVLTFPALALSPITVVIDCIEAGGEIERIPAPDIKTVCGVALPAFHIDAAAPFAADKVAALCDALCV